MTHVTFRLTAKNRDQLRNPTLGNRVWATFYLYLLVTLALQGTVLNHGLGQTDGRTDGQIAALFNAHTQGREITVLRRLSGPGSQGGHC